MTLNLMTDSTCDLGADLAARYGIRVLPMYVNTRGHTYRDGVDITLEELFRSVQESGQLPKTSAPTVADFHQAFIADEETVYISISSKLSATHQNALLAREMALGRTIHIVDSLNLSTGIGLLAIKAAEMRDAGLPGAEIARRITALVPQVRTSFVVETLDYLYKGGRCTALQSIMSSMLSIRPIIAVRPDGTLGMKAKTRGSRQKALQTMLNAFCEDLPDVDLDRVFVTHTGCGQDAEYLKSALLRAAPIREVGITTAGCVIASHCGPGTIGIIYLKK